MANNKSERNRPDFLIIPCILYDNPKIRSRDREVYGVIYWYKKLKNEKCTAANKTIAGIINSTPGSVANSISRLSDEGYIEVRLDENNHREEIIPLITYRSSPTDEPPLHPQVKGPSPTGDTPPSPTGGENKNNSNKNNKKNKTPLPLKDLNGSSEEDMAAANRLLREKVREIFDFYMEKSGDDKRRVLTEKRKGKITKRLESFSADEIKEAISNCFSDSFFSGNNERKWKADIDYIFRNDENLEKLLFLTPQADSGTGKFAVVDV